jgi:hypothetical protein
MSAREDKARIAELQALYADCQNTPASALSSAPAQMQVEDAMVIGCLLLESDLLIECVLLCVLFVFY